MIHMTKRVATEYGFKHQSTTSKHIHLIHVKDGDDDYFGVSLEPEPYKVLLSYVSDSLLYYLVQDPDNGATMAETPFVFDKVPKIPEDGDLFLLRDASPGEISEWSARNDILLSKLGIQPVPTTESVMVQDDARYNILRGEFGIGEKGKPKWRDGLRKLKRKIPELNEELGDIIENMKFPSVGTFEERSKEWLKDNEHTVLILVGG